MENTNPTPTQNVNPATLVVAPVVAPMPAPVAGPMQPMVAPMAAHKPSHKGLYALLTVFVVMGGALAAVGVLKPDLVTSTFAWVTKTPMHAAAPESRVLVNGTWVDSTNPGAELAKAKKPLAPVVEVKAEGEKVEAPAVAPATPEAPATPSAPTVPVTPTAPATPAQEPAAEPEQGAAPATPEAAKAAPEAPSQSEAKAGTEAPAQK
jgi:hypothetical protein